MRETPWDASRRELRVMYEFRTDPIHAIQAIAAAVDAFEADGSIGGGAAASLRAFVREAEAAIHESDHDAAIRSLTRFIDDVGRQTPRHITEDAARTLISMVRRA